MLTMQKQQKEVTVRVVRPFCIDGEPVAADTVITLDSAFASELMTANKVVATDEKPRGPRKADKSAKADKPSKPEKAEKANSNESGKEGETK